MNDAVYRFSTEKAFAAIHWMVSQGAPIDLHCALKACYFADRSHLNEHFQPIFGAKYMAMKYGPVPLEIYEMMKGEGLYMWELKTSETPWQIEGYQLSMRINSVPDMTGFSESEMSHLTEGFNRSKSMTFTARTAATHGYDWQKANGGIMRYEDMIDESDNKERIIHHIRDNASHTRL